MARKKIAKAARTAARPEPRDDREQDDPNRAAAEVGRRAQRDHFNNVNRVFGSLNDDLTKAYRDWAARQYSAMAQFFQSCDNASLQKELQAADEAYWNAVRDVQQSSSQRLADSYQSYVGAIKDAVAAVDPKSADSGTLCFLAQTLNTAAALAGNQQWQPEPAERAGG